MATLEASGEPPIPVYAELLKTYETRERTAPEILQVCSTLAACTRDTDLTKPTTVNYQSESI
jgi:hypothetical protein